MSISGGPKGTATNKSGDKIKRPIMDSTGAKANESNGGAMVARRTEGHNTMKPIAGENSLPLISKKEACLIHHNKDPGSYRELPTGSPRNSSHSRLTIMEIDPRPQKASQTNICITTERVPDQEQAHQHVTVLCETLMEVLHCSS